MKPIMAIFIHDPQCETDCALGMINVFVKDFDIRTFGIEELSSSFLDKASIVAFPGGMGNSDDFYDIFSAYHQQVIHRYIAKGGKYLGICMGAYWAGPLYFNIIGAVEVEPYIAQPTADITYDGPTVAAVTWLGEQEVMYFYDGCTIIGEDIDVVATYANGDVMAAISGNVGMIGCHPESLEWWFEEGEMDIEYYDPKHAELMINFAKQLIKYD